MRPFLLCCALLVLSANSVRSEYLSQWRQSTDPKTQVSFTFVLSDEDFTPFENANTDGELEAMGKLYPKPKWLYLVILEGKSAKMFDRKSITIAKREGQQLVEIISGEIVLDDKLEVISIALKTIEDGATKNFRGNGSYSLKEKLSPRLPPASL